MSVKELIRQLAHVKSVESFEPDPIEDALVHKGNAAVEPLLDCFVHDQRLTQAALPDFHGNRPPVPCPVYQVAFGALERICRHSFSDVEGPKGTTLYETPAGRVELAGIIRKYWQKNQSTPVLERCFRTLKDDRAGVQEWMQAAEYHVQPLNVSTGIDPPEELDESPPGGNPTALRGEPLRGRENPSVGQLLEKRVCGIAALPDPAWRQNYGEAAALTRPLFTWEGKAAIGTVHGLCRAMVTRDCSGEDSAQSVPVWAVIPLILRLMDLGDPKIQEDYTHWVREISPERAGVFTPDWFEPL